MDCRHRCVILANATRILERSPTVRVRMANTDFEPGIVTDLAHRLTYGGYLRLDHLLEAQQPLSIGTDHLPRHDEMLFIVQHQVSELWMKLLIHELKAAIAHVKADALESNFKILARVKLIQKQLFEQWAVLETLTPSEFEAFRPALATSSGFQSVQYRAIEFLLGNKNARMVDVFRARRARSRDVVRTVARAVALRRIHSPSGAPRFAGAARLPDRDVTLPYVRHPDLVPVFKTIYENPKQWWDAYDMCEKLIDIEEGFQLWRFRHMKTVERIIGHQSGTGGSSGVTWLKRALDQSFFPELIDVRAVIGKRCTDAERPKSTLTLFP